MIHASLLIFFFFFFSSRRRHTRFKCDWSSDVCSSDLVAERRDLALQIRFDELWHRSPPCGDIVTTSQKRAGPRGPALVVRLSCRCYCFCFPCTPTLESACTLIWRGFVSAFLGRKMRNTPSRLCDVP